MAKKLREKARRLPTPISVDEALREPSMNISVPDGTELVLGPFNSKASEFRLAEITTFEDLHKLGFVPDKISEDQALEAIRADDRIHRAALQRHQEAGGSCTCEDVANSQFKPIRRMYYQDNLIELLQPLYRGALRVADPTVIHPFRHLQTWFSRPNKYLVGIFFLNDINIGRRATLIMTPTVNAMYARNINMDAESRLRFASGHVHVRCETLNGPTPFSAIDNIDKYVAGLGMEFKEARP